MSGIFQPGDAGPFAAGEEKVGHFPVCAVDDHGRTDGAAVFGAVLGVEPAFVRTVGVFQRPANRAEWAAGGGAHGL